MALIMYEYNEERLNTLQTALVSDIRQLRGVYEEMCTEDKKRLVPALVAYIEVAERAVTQAFCAVYNANIERSLNDETGNKEQD